MQRFLLTRRAFYLYSPRLHRFAAALLLALLVVQALLVAALPDFPPMGDEPYYLAKARHLRAHGSFPRADARTLAIERGEVWGTDDYRPPGYPALLALIGPSRARVKWVQFVCVAALLIAIHFIATKHGAHPVATALLLGVAPWPLEWVTSILADPLNAVVNFIGLLLLWRAIVTGRATLAFAGALLVSATLLFRADMILLPPVVFAAVWWMCRRFAVPMAAAFLMVVGMQYAYRVHFTGDATTSLYAPFRLQYGHALKWSGTWLGTERETTSFVWTLSEGRVPPPLPSRAWGDEEEKRAIEGVVADVTRTGRYTEAHDAVFARLREKRVRDNFLGAFVAPRIWNAIHLWANSSTNAQLLRALVAVPRPARRLLLGALLLLKLAIFVLFARALLRQRTPLVLLCALFVIARTLEIGALNAGEHRYALVAWLPLLLCATFGTITLPTRRPAAGS